MGFGGKSTDATRSHYSFTQDLAQHALPCKTEVLNCVHSTFPDQCAKFTVAQVNIPAMTTFGRRGVELGGVLPAMNLR